MATHRAELTTRSRDERTWDAGLHGEGEQGPIDVGLSLEPEALGVVVDAPGVGVLRVAFQLSDDGHTRLVLASRRLADGRDVAVISDETRTTRLEGQVLGLQSQVELLTTERDEARDRAATLGERQAALERRLVEAQQSLTAEREALLAQVEVERDQRLVALGDREKARAELERAREELGAGSATLMREVAEARAGRDAVEAERSQLSQELTLLSARLHALGLEHEAALSARSELEQEVLSSEAELERRAEAIRALEVELERQAAATSALQASLDALGARTSGLETELYQATDSLAGVQVQASHARALEAERDALLVQRKELEGRLKTLEMSETTLRRRLEALGAAQRGADAAQGEQQRLLDEARAHAQRLEGQLELEQRSTVEAREVARLLKVQLDRTAQEREEARGIARTLHAKAGGSSAVDQELSQVRAAALAEQQRLAQQIESLGRQLDQERSARARTLAELDDARRRLQAPGALAPGTTLGAVPEDTRPFRVPKRLLEAAQTTNPAIVLPPRKP